MEQIRIVKEMRERDERNGRTGVNVRPRYMVWENVPGAFSSNRGEDFRIVLEELAKIADKDAVIPMPDKGKWTTCGCIVGDGWSIAWRVLDAQFWGVPQRRRRIALVADFGGQSAPEILFVRESVSGHTDESQPQGKETACDASRCFGADNRLGEDQYNAVIIGDTVSTLGVDCGISHGRQCALEPRPVTARCFLGNGGACGEISSTLVGDHQNRVTDFTSLLVMKNTGDVRTSNVVIALDRASYNQGKNAQFDFEVSDKGINSPLVAKGPGAVCYGIDHVITTGGSCTAKGSCVYDGIQATLKAGGVHAVCYSIDQGGGKSACNVQEGQSPTLTCTHGGEPAVCYSTNHGSFHTIAEEGIVATLQATDYKDPPTATYRCGTRYIVRRLTPLECERLQGYPDGWTDIGEWTDSNGKKRQTSDAARYKALGNSIALPPWKWVLKRLCACYERNATMASLFDGIGGFPYLWEQLNGKGSCLWASEIEEFPIAVTKVRIGGKDNEQRTD